MRARFAQLMLVAVVEDYDVVLPGLSAHAHLYGNPVTIVELDATERVAPGHAAAAVM